LISSAGAVQYSTTYGIEGFSATPGFGTSGTLFEADDDGIPGNGQPDDPYDAVAFSVAGGQAQLVRGYKIPFTLGISSGERLSVVIDRDDTSYWCSGAQCFGLTPPAQGFAPIPGWPKAGITIAPPPFGATDVISDLAMDPNPGGFLFAYDAWPAIDLN